jgi:O-antigen/teichoic acid export membrane protein
VLSAGELAEPSPVFELVWQLHAAAWALALPALGTTFIGAALAAHTSRLTPPWQRLLGVAGGGLLLAAGVANLAIADGSALLFVGLPGLAAWLVWLLATGVRLVRARTADRPDNASANKRLGAPGRVSSM